MLVTGPLSTLYWLVTAFQCFCYCLYLLGHCLSLLAHCLRLSAHIAEQSRRALQTRNPVAERTDDVGGKEESAIRGVPLVLQGEGYSCNSIPSLTKGRGDERRAIRTYGLSTGIEHSEDGTRSESTYPKDQVFSIIQ